MRTRLFTFLGLFAAAAAFGGTQIVRSIAANAGPATSAGPAQIIIVIGDFSLGPASLLQVTVSPSSSTPPITVGGIVTLGNATLIVINTAPFAPGTVVTMISNDGASPVAGTFNGLAEGAIVTTATGQMFRISYVGGTGNDVTLTALPTLPLLSSKALMMLIVALAIVGLRARSAF